MTSDSRVSTNRRWKFIATATGWLLLAYLSSVYLRTFPFWFLVLCVLTFAAPIAISGAYSSAVNQTRMLSLFRSSGRMHKLFSGRITRSMVWIVWALVSAFAMLIQFTSYTAFNWVVLALAIPAYWLIHSACIRFLATEIDKPYVIESLGIVWARWLCTLLLTTVFGCASWWLSEVPEISSLAESLAESQYESHATTGSSVVQLALGWFSFVDGTKTYLGRSLYEFGAHIPWLLSMLGGFLVFFNACVTFGCFVLPATEYRRVLGPVSDEVVPAPLTRLRVAASAAVITVFSVFIFIPLFAQLEIYVRNTPELLTTVRNAQRLVEKIDDQFYAPGTLRELEQAKVNALAKLTLHSAILNEQIDNAFNQMESRVDGYLDWYYSLSGEYARLSKLMTGELETYMQEKLIEKLEQEQALQPVFTAMASLSGTYRVASEQYRNDAKRILDSNRLRVPELGAKEIPSLDLDHVLALPKHVDAIAMEKRIAGGAAAAGVGAAVVAKLAGKGVFKIAGKALSKVAISKVAATGSGVAIGAAIGSFIPVLGTAVGGVVGGLVAGIAADKVLLELEEVYGREDFKNEIIDSIRQARDNFKSDLQVHGNSKK